MSGLSAEETNTVKLDLVEDPFEVGVVTRDLSNLLRFYAQILGLPVGRANEVPGRGRVARVQCGRAVIKFVEPVPRPEVGPLAESLVDTTGIHYLTMIVKNSAELYEQFEQAGYVVAGSRLENESRVLFTIRDPDGNLIEVLEHFH
jgi:catechol 2,3-dioxygenase-like lactoylglutathione lyase family enzyme